MPEDKYDRGEKTDRGKEMRDRENALGPQPVPQEQFGEAAAIWSQTRPQFRGRTRPTTQPIRGPIPIRNSRANPRN